MDSLSAHLFIVCSVLFENPGALSLYLFIYFLSYYFSLAGLYKAVTLHLLIFLQTPNGGLLYIK